VTAATPTPLPIPAALEDLTPEWLTAALRERGVLREANVVSVESEILGEGEGFIGLIVRLRPGLDRDEPGAPASLIAKLPTPVAQNRAAGEQLGVYEREILFYEELAGAAGLRTPRCYYSAMEPLLGAAWGPAITRFLDRLPYWLLRVLVWLGSWLARQSKRRYVLLLEDLAPGRVGDQLAGCDPEAARQVLRTLASMHASLWNDPRLDQWYWIPDLDLAPRMLRTQCRRARPGFDAEFGDRISPRMRELADWLDTNAVSLTHELASGAMTLLHGDYRLDNFCFEAAGDVTVFDWQIAARGPGPYDVAYFLGSSFGGELSFDEELELLRTYHAELLELGVEAFDFVTCLEQYRGCLLLMLQRIIMGCEQVEFRNERGRKLIASWIDRLGARLEHLPDPDEIT
jgi:hypothetical protein